MSEEKSKLIRDRLLMLEGMRDDSRYWNISWDLGIILKNFVEIKRPKRVLEIGTSNGFSALCMFLGMGDEGVLETIDVDFERIEKAKNNLKAVGLQDRVVFHNMEVEEAICKLEGKFDMVFLDAGHKKYQKIFSLLLEKNLLEDNCLFIADNVLSHSYMGEFIEFMKYRYESEVIEIDSGFLVSIISLKENKT